jgi:Mg2+ and Co2+ transporter CorA
MLFSCKLERTPASNNSVPIGRNPHRMLRERKLEGGGLWVDLLDPTDDEARRVQSAHGVRVPPRKELEEIESSSRLSRDGTARRRQQRPLP